MKRKNIVWNLTRLCPFRCSFCCVSATYVHGFQQVHPIDDDTPVIEGELSFNQQVEVLKQLDPNKFKIDFSGGDILINPRNIDLILIASEKFGTENIGLSIPGTFTTPQAIEMLSGKISGVEITMDNIPGVNDPQRPLSYAKYASLAIQRLVNAGFYVGVQTVLRKENMLRGVITELHNHLKILGVQKWSFLQFAPVGRGYSKYEHHPTNDEYEEFSDVLEQITSGSSLEIHYQYLMPLKKKRTFHCRAVGHSIGITPNGKVSACFWAFKPNGELFDEVVLGRVPKENIADILQSEKSKKWLSNNEKENYCPLKKILKEIKL